MNNKNKKVGVYLISYGLNFILSFTLIWGKNFALFPDLLKTKFFNKTWIFPTMIVGLQEIDLETRIKSMVIEWLKVRVSSPEILHTYIQKDEEVWTSFLSKWPGFLRKEVWIDSDEPTEIRIVIHWASREKWKSVPSDLLEQTRKKFAQQMGNTYEIVESNCFDVLQISDF